MNQKLHRLARHQLDYLEESWWQAWAAVEGQNPAAADHKDFPCQVVLSSSEDWVPF